ncbi:hypothetical protein CEXT_788731 [Caerostris extrusa]|uniref:Uncharacterized protein n=1 Tax=Caerostris extrusa TaxID=172846 RepID=A0AAV4XPM3_CAEEX|nr:hypothetical protein CEXT_788731 [Caerostris extrusa]
MSTVLTLQLGCIEYGLIAMGRMREVSSSKCIEITPPERHVPIVGLFEIFDGWNNGVKTIVDGGVPWSAES